MRNKRVEIPPYTDLWMRGARFGTVVKATGKKDEKGRAIIAVKMDHPQVKRLARVVAEDCRFLS